MNVAKKYFAEMVNIWKQAESLVEEYKLKNLNNYYEWKSDVRFYGSIEYTLKQDILSYLSSFIVFLDKTHGKSRSLSHEVCFINDLLSCDYDKDSLRNISKMNNVPFEIPFSVVVIGELEHELRKQVNYDKCDFCVEMIGLFISISELFVGECILYFDYQFDYYWKLNDYYRDYVYYEVITDEIRDRISYLLNQALQYAENNEYEKACEIYHIICGYEKRNIIACCGMAFCLCRLKKYEKAKYFIDLVLESDDNSIEGKKLKRSAKEMKEEIAIKQTSVTNERNNSCILLNDRKKVEQNLVEVEKESSSDYLQQLNDLIGLAEVKNDVSTLINMIRMNKIRAERGLKQIPISKHLVFSGNPGTGKTTVARLLAKIYKDIGVLSGGHLIEVDRSKLVAGYVGQTAIQTQEVIQKSLGGILFIDEAYTLSSVKESNDFGQEAIDTILKAMEDYREDFVVIVAGYPTLMEEFLDSNPGLRSRFNKFIYFEDHSPNELVEIFKRMCDVSGYIIDNNTEKFIYDIFLDKYSNRNSNFSNGREVRNIFEKVVSNQANRLSIKYELTDDELMTLLIDDVKGL